MPYLSCPNCRLTVSDQAVRSPFQYCPRCMLIERAQHAMVPSPNRFDRSKPDLQRVAEAKARLSGRMRPAG